MRKFIRETLKPYDFQFERNAGYGVINGYEVNVTINPYIGPSFLFSTYLPMEKKKEVANRIVALSGSKLRASAHEQGIILNMAYAGTIFTYPKRFNEVLPFVFQALEEYEAPKNNICPQTGEELTEENSKLARLPKSEFKVRMSSSGVTALNADINKSNEDYKNAPNNYGRGFLGILIGALAGAILTVVFGLMGFITFIAPIGAIILGTFLYRKFGGKPNAVMIVMSFIITLITIFCAFIIVYVVTATTICLQAGVDKSGFEALKTCLELSEEFERTFYLDLGMNGLFVLGAEAGSIAFLVRSIRRPKTV